MDAAVGRRALLRGLAAGGLATLAGCASTLPGGDRGENGDSDGIGNPDGEGPGPGPSAVGLEPVVTDLAAPVAVAFDGERDRTYVAELGGRIVRYDGIGDGNGDGPAEDPVLELGDAVEVGGERGLLGIALHPAFPDDPRLFVRYSAPARPGTPSGFSHTFVLSSFELVDEGRRAASATERAILELPQPQSNHNAGDLAFGPDGDLYVPTGDGGAAGDRGRGHVEDWYDAVPGGNGQDVEDNLLGSVLRIDVDMDVDDDGARPYAIPDDNPLLDGPGRDEHFAWGFRNPWRLSFDGDDLFVADVGQDRFEEVNLVERGGNYGWNVREGEGCYGGPSACPSATPGDVRGGEPLRDPIVAYPHDGPGVTGISVIGGYVYRGEELPELDGTYVFGDLDPRGRLLLAGPPRDGGGGGDGGNDDDGAGRGTWSLAAVEVRAAGTDEAGGPGDLDRLLSFARDGDGEVYVLGTAHAGEGVYRLVPVE